MLLTASCTVADMLDLQLSNCSMQRDKKSINEQTDYEPEECLSSVVDSMLKVQLTCLPYLTAMHFVVC